MLLPSDIVSCHLSSKHHTGHRIVDDITYIYESKYVICIYSRYCGLVATECTTDFAKYLCIFGCFYQARNARCIECIGIGSLQTQLRTKVVGYTSIYIYIYMYMYIIYNTYQHSYIHAKPCIRFCFLHMTDFLVIIQLVTTVTTSR